MLALLASCRSPADPSASESYAASFARVWQTADREYSYFTHKGIDWPAMRTAFAPRAAAATSDSAFAAVILEMLAVLRDVHVSVVSPAGRVQMAMPFAPRRNWTRESWERTLAGATVPYRNTGDVGDARFTVGARHVGYLWVGGWNSMRTSVAAIDAALERLRDADALVIDVRANGGGDQSLALQLAGRLTTVRRLASAAAFRNGPRHDDFAAPVALFTEPRGPFAYTRPVFLLIGRGCVSSCEGFASAMEALPTVTLVGDTTYGGSGNPGIYPLRGGWTMRLSRWIEYTARQQIIEDRGLAPAEPITGDAAVTASGRDAVLEAVLARAAR